MDYLKAVAGALAIMMGAGMIADYDVLEYNDAIYVTVWSADDQSDLRLRRHVAAMLPGAVDENHVFVNRDGVISV